MPRPEKPIQPGGPVADFALALRALRDAAGRPSYAVMARLAYSSQAVLSEAAAGRSLPTWEATRAYVRACGGDESDWRARWEAARCPETERNPS
ncbi:hypothetical protein Afil01_22270 [Actinorhabdospora filicis]|uniref:Helix-turn-helix domain-containing protein n=1 Tax=Actinorhabdospora filicis TaxID=1785913 RepID=A0A9W6WA98_9ACTN|nr:helix-turn-helix domain-containing protein [Actinorhabdospora filicis]GLZ77420.1 hypothetical protein Afil01_22270 [Actinorhabdospora filicis]